MLIITVFSEYSDFPSISERVVHMDDDEQKQSVTPRLTIPINGPLDRKKNSWDDPKPFDELPPEVQAMLLRRAEQKDKGKSTLEILEGKHVMSCLLFIEEKEPVLKSDIYNNISRSAGMVEKINDLCELGLICIYETARTHSNVIVLTDKGHRAVKVIRRLIDLADEPIGEIR